MLTANDLMTIDPNIISPQATLREAIVLMNQANNRQLPVVADGKLLGIITDRDIRLAVNSPLKDDDPLERIELLDNFTVKHCMTVDPITIASDTPMYHVAELLSIYKFGALPVVNGEKKLEGIITVTDLLNRMALRPEQPAE
jgi:acetoin utilization protein AcuB